MMIFSCLLAFALLYLASASAVDVGATGNNAARHTLRGVNRKDSPFQSSDTGTHSDSTLHTPTERRNIGSGDISINFNINISMQLGDHSWSFRDSQTSISREKALETFISLFSEEEKQSIEADFDSEISLIRRALRGLPAKPSQDELVPDLIISDAPPNIPFYLEFDEFNDTLPVESSTSNSTRMLTDPKSIDYSRSLQVCTSGEAKTQIRIYVASDTDNLNWTLANSTGDIMLQGGNYVFDGDGLYYNAETCIDPLDCYTFEISGFSYDDSYEKYEIIVNDTIYKSGVGYSGTFVEIGNCGDDGDSGGTDGQLTPAPKPENCDLKLILSPTNQINPDSFDSRSHEILHVIMAISGIDPLVTVDSPQYQAACWILYDDLRKLNVTDPSLVQRYVLAVLYFSTGGKEWKNGFKFLSSEDECRWNDVNENIWGKLGVKCTDRRVSAINLASNNLNGYLVTEISKLNSVNSLVLESNTLKGTIPYELGEALNLYRLVLGNNQMEGTIPEKLYQLENLQILTLERNFFNGSLSTHVGNLNNLTFLGLSQNMIEGPIPEEIYDINSLERLEFQRNFMTGTISTKIGRLFNLKSLDLSQNNFSGFIPSEIGNTSLQTLNLDSNSLIGSIPSELGRLLDLRKLLASSNRLIGTIPDDIGKLKNLNTIDLSYNRIAGGIPSFLAPIQIIRLNNNLLDGSFPASFANLKDLFELRLEANDLTGTVSREVCSHFEQSPGDLYGFQTVFNTDCAHQFLPPKVICSCCTSCFDQFVLNSYLGSCPGGEIKIEVDYSQSDWYKLSWFLRDSSNRIIFGDGPLLSLPSYSSYRSCISETDCFFFQTNNPTGNTFMQREIFIDGKLLDDSFDTTIEFGYDSATESIAIGECDPIWEFEQELTVGSLQRQVYNQLVEASGLAPLNNLEMPQYKAAEWIFNELHENHSPYGNLIQRYILALLYFSSKGEYWVNNTGYLTEQHECEWYGIICDNDGVVKEINLANNNLEGTLLKELSQLYVVESLDLSNNEKLVGNIPAELANMWSLRELDLGGNNLSGSIPTEFGEMDSLERLDLHKNSLSGGLPDLDNLSMLEILNLSNNNLGGKIMEDGLPSKSLVRLDLSSNLLTGTIPSSITNASNLIELILSDNGFMRNIPSDIGKLSCLTQLALNGNRLSGIIPTGISNMSKITNLMLYSNELTGTLPTELGSLQDLENISMSYNSLEGSIPSEMRDLEKLSLLHLQGNMLTGSTSWMDNCNIWPRDRSFIADCGEPTDSSSQLECKCCTECCNSYERCQANNVYDFTPIQYVFMSMGAISGCLFIVSATTIFAVIREWVKMKFVHVDALRSSGDESVYCLVLTRNVVCWIITTVTVCIQVMLFVLFLRAANSTYEDSDWIYSIRCPVNSLECQDEKSISTAAWLIFGVFIIISLTPDLTNGLKLMYKAASTASFRCLASGTILVFVTILAGLTSYFYNNAIAQSDTEVIINAAILLFVNDVDERMFLVLKSTFPKWVKSKIREARDFSDELSPRSDKDESGFDNILTVQLEQLPQVHILEELKKRVEALEKKCQVLEKNSLTSNSQLECKRVNQ